MHLAGKDAWVIWTSKNLADSILMPSPSKLIPLMGRTWPNLKNLGITKAYPLLLKPETFYMLQESTQEIRIPRTVQSNDQGTLMRKIQISLHWPWPPQYLNDPIALVKLQDVGSSDLEYHEYCKMKKHIEPPNSVISVENGLMMCTPRHQVAIHTGW